MKELIIEKQEEYSSIVIEMEVTPALRFAWQIVQVQMCQTISIFRLRLILAWAFISTVGDVTLEVVQKNV